ncbi:MAG: hypothetical protein ACK5NL_11935 [Vibrio fluvialis]
MQFSHILRKIMLDRHLSNQMLLAILQTDERYKTSIDETVVAQWVEHKRLPPFKEQVYLCLFLGMSFQQILLNLTLPAIDNAFVAPLKQLFPSQTQYTSLSYIPSYHSPKRLKLHDQATGKTKVIIEKYYDHFDVYLNKSLRQLLQDEESTTTMCVLQPHYKVPNSHLCYSRLHKHLAIDTLGLVLPSDNILIHPAYFNGLAELVHLIGWFVIKVSEGRTLNEILRTSVFSITRESQFFELYDKLGAKVIYESSPNRPYIAIYKTPLFNIMTNHNLLHFSKEVSSRI